MKKESVETAEQVRCVGAHPLVAPSAGDG